MKVETAPIVFDVSVSVPTEILVAVEQVPAACVVEQMVVCDVSGCELPPPRPLDFSTEGETLSDVSELIILPMTGEFLIDISVLTSVLQILVTDSQMWIQTWVLVFEPFSNSRRIMRAETKRMMMINSFPDMPKVQSRFSYKFKRLEDQDETRFIKE